MDEIDETERQREAAMEIIAKAGAARSCAFAAIHRAKAFDFGGAAEQLDEAERYATEAHKVHTELLVREAGGQQTDGGLLVAHAQDHFMMATLAQELAEEIVEAALRRSGEWAGLDAAETGNAPDGAYRYALYEAHGAARVPYAYGILGQQRLDGEWKTVAMIAPFSNDSAATAHLARLCTGQQLEPIHILDVIHDFMNTEARTL